MRDYCDYFKNKKITLMGLGLLGRGLGDAIFLAECGANLIVTDVRDEKTLAPSLAKLKKYSAKGGSASGGKNIRYTLGTHRLEDFRNRDFILKAAGVPLDSPYTAEARKHGIPIEMDASLFAKLMPKGVTLVGVTGTRGKSTTTALIYDILRSGLPSVSKEGKRGVVGSVYKGGNLVPEATLPLLKKVKAYDIVVLELDSWQLQGFHDAKISPQIAVFTTFLDDHLVYYKGDREKYFDDKAAIFKYQKKGDVLVVGKQAAPRIRAARTHADLIVARAADVPKEWKIKLLGEHNRENVACAIAAARALGVQDAVIKKAVVNFRGIPGRLEYLRTVRGVKIYNDNNATTPDATIAALKALRDLRFKKYDLRKGDFIHKSKIINHKSIVLIMGGTDKVLGKHGALIAEIPKYCKAVVCLKETGTEKFLSQIPLNKVGAESARRGLFILKETLQECIEAALKHAKKGDIILFSPAFASFGKWFKNEYDRGNQFVELVKKL